MTDDGIPDRRDEPSRKRTFQARGIVWSTFESLARETNTPIDELVNEAMAAYARVRGYNDADSAQRKTPPVPPPTSGRVTDPSEETVDAPGPPPIDEDDLLQTGRGEIIPVGKAMRDPETIDARTPARKPPPPLRPEPPPPPQRRGLPRPPPLPGALPMTGAGPASSTPALGTEVAKHLVIRYEGRAYDVDKERFLIGRSKTQADLRLDDANVSRQHAVVERVGAAWYIVDLGSTNGVHVAGERVTRRALSDGDVIIITKHELHCTLR